MCILFFVVGSSLHLMRELIWFKCQSVIIGLSILWNQNWISSWNQPVLINKSKVSCSIKQQEPLMGFKLTPDEHKTSQTCQPCHSLNYFKITAIIKLQSSPLSITAWLKTRHQTHSIMAVLCKPLIGLSFNNHDSQFCPDSKTAINYQGDSSCAPSVYQHNNMNLNIIHCE